MQALSYPSLSDGVIALRRWRVDDADRQLLAFTDPVFLTFSDWAPSTRAGVVDRITVLEQERRAGRSLHLAISDARDGVVLGEVSLSDIDPEHRRGSVGYWLVPGARGRGAASRAVRLLIAWVFSDLGLARLELTCGPDNLASQRVARRCGFREEGLLRSAPQLQGRTP